MFYSWRNVPFLYQLLRKVVRDMRNAWRWMRMFSFLNGYLPGGGGGTPLYKLYRYVPPQRVWFSSRFGLKTGIDFDHYGLKSGMVFKGTTGAYKRMCLFNSK